MNPWPFIIAAYAVAVAMTTLLVAWSYAGMKRAEAAADELGRK